MRRSLATSVAMVILLGTLAGGASAQESPTPAPSLGTGASPSTSGDLTFTVGSVEDMKSISPFWACCSPEYEMMFMVYDQLLNFDAATLKPVPGVAQSWDKNADATEWIFHLAPDLKWSDGKPLTSKDVKFTYDYILNNRPNSFTGYVPGDPVIETPDPQTVIYRTKEPSLAPSSPAWVPILPEHVWKKFDGDIEGSRKARMLPTVGSGPFVLTDWKEGQFWTFEKNPYWRGEEPTIDHIVFRVFDQPESMVQALKTGEIDFAEAVPPPLFDHLVRQKDPNVETWQASERYWHNVAFGLWKPNQLGAGGEKPTNHPALQDPRVRVAIAKAIDKQTLVDKTRLGMGSVANSLILPSSRWYWNPEDHGDTTQRYNPDEANKILDEAGYLDTNGDGIREMPGGGDPLILKFLTITDYTGSVSDGEYIKGWLADIGIKVNLKPVSTGKAYDAWYAHDFDAYLWGYGQDPDPDFILSIFTTGQCDNWSDGCYSNPAYDKLYEEQRAATDDAQRGEIIDQMQKIVYDDVPEVLLYYENDLQAWRKDRWTGFVPQPAPHGSVLYGFSAASYLNIEPVTSAEGSDPPSGSDGAAPVVWISIGLVALVAIIAVIIAIVRRKPEEDRD